jgi:RNA polymerase sigma-70 factor (ECF subfamily)
MDTYKGEVSFGAWLKKIVINKSLDVIKKKSLDTESIEESLVDVPFVEPESEKMENLNVKVEEVRDAINQLPEKYRIVLSLYLIEGYDHDEIAEILDINSSTSRSQLVRAKQKIIQIISEGK